MLRQQAAQFGLGQVAPAAGLQFTEADVGDADAAQLVDAVAESEGDGSLKPAVALLPESLDDIAPARELSASQVRLVDQAQQILDLLPGPVIETGEFLHRGSEGTSLHGTKNSAHNHDLADNS